MKALIIGCGRVGSTIALQLLSEEWEVAVVDEKRVREAETAAATAASDE